jgi:glucoamylase
MWSRQQQPDGHLPQNTTVWGKPVWTSVQLDETSDPVILAWQLRRTNAYTWRHVRRALHFILNFSTEGHAAPYTQQERWENQSGYSPATIAAEIAALVCGARIADANGAHALARHYRAVADNWQRRVNGWTATTNGPYSPKPYYLRLTKDGNPDAGTTYDLGDTGPNGVDQRAVVDPSFLELVRLGVKPASGPVVRNTVAVVDKQLAVRTPNGVFWHRYNGDGYGEQRDGGPWNIGFPAGSRTTLGRVWPIFAGERGEYRLLVGRSAAAQLAAMAKASNDSLLIPEQVWDGRPPTGQPGFPAGEPTHSATPLAWSHAQFIRLAWSMAAGHPVEQPRVVACRYARHC